MLHITIPSSEQYNEETNEFLFTKEQSLQLEHSLISLSKWESKWNKSFLDTKNKTYDEIIDYIKCMTLTQNVSSEVYYNLSPKNVEEINEYINAPMTATTFSDKKKSGSKEIVTSELIYYWMIAYGIPFECQKWHINRLLTLIRVCSIKNAPKKKTNRRELMERNAAINAARRKKLNTKG